jgi:hypothetical protein
MTEPLKTFKNPYPLEGEYDPSTQGRVQLDLPKDIKHRVTTCRPTTGTAQIVGNLLWQKLITALDKHNINNFSQQHEFEQFLLNSELVATCAIGNGCDNIVARPEPTGSSADRTPAQAPASNDNGRKTRVARGAKKPKSK